MKNTYLSFFFIFVSLQCSNAQAGDFTYRFFAGTSISEPDTRNKSIVSELQIGPDFKEIIMEADASYLNSYFFFIEAAYSFFEKLEAVVQLGHSMFYDDFPMPVRIEHFSRSNQWVGQPIILLSEYFNYSFSPAIGVNLSLVNLDDFEMFIGTNVTSNITYFKLITSRLHGLRPYGSRGKFFFDAHSVEAFASVGVRFMKSRFFVDYRYFLTEYKDDVTENDGVAIKYENLTKFRFRLSYDLEWKKSR